MVPPRTMRIPSAPPKSAIIRVKSAKKQQNRQVKPILVKLNRGHDLRGPASRTNSSLSPRFIDSLTTVGERIGKLETKWIVVGSLSLALQGVRVRPQDIDILTSKRGAFTISRQLKEYETREVGFRKSHLFQSYLGEFKIGGVKIQVMGDLKARVRNRWVSGTPRSRNPRIIRLRGRSFRVIPLEKQLESYKALARKKDEPKIEKIQEFLTASHNALSPQDCASI